jgi:hypothetical protein
MQSAAEGEVLFWPAATAESAVEHLVNGRCGVLLVDLARTAGDVAVFLSRLVAQFPCLVLLVAGRREDEGTVTQLLTSGVVYRYLHKPVSPGRAQQFLNAAVSRARQLNEREPIGLSTVRELVRVAVWHKLYQYSVRALGMISVVVLAGLIASMVKHAMQPDPGLPLKVPPAPPVAASPPPTVTPVAVPREQSIPQPPVAPLAPTLDERARDVQQKIHGGRLNDATRALRELAALAPGDERIVTLATSIGELLLTRSSVAIGEGDLDLAQRRIDAAIAVHREFNVELPELASTQSALEQARALALNAELESFLNMARSQREVGNLIRPEGESAYDQVQFARTRAPEAAEVRAETQALAIALLAAAEEAIAEQRFGDARDLLDHADALVPATSAARQLRAELGQLDRPTAVGEQTTEPDNQ